MKNALFTTVALSLFAAPLTAQEFSPTRSVTAFTQIIDEIYDPPTPITDLQEASSMLAGFFEEELEADTMFGGSETYADAGQTSWIDPAGGDFECEGYAAGGLYNQLAGEMRAESLFQADFVVATSGSLVMSYEFVFGDSFGGLTSQERPGQSIGEVRIEDSMGITVFADESSFEDGDISGFANVPLGPGQYRFVARVEIVDATANQVVAGSMTTADFYVEGTISGGAPVPPPEPDTTPPAAPTGLVAVAGNGSVLLDWADNGEADLSGYLVYRSLASGGPYSQLTASQIVGSALNDTTAVNGTTYYYVVTALDLTGNESGNSGEVSATPTAPPVTMHVASITTSRTGPKRRRRGVATVQIVTETGDPVAGALVSGSFSGDYTDVLSGTTNGSGIVTLISSRRNIRNPVFTFCVDDVTHATFVYDSGSNVETCESYP